MNQLLVEKHNNIQSFNYGYLNKKSIVSMCYLLASNSLQTSILEYQSLKYLKMIASNQFSWRSVDSFVKNLVQLGILQKLPRKKQQSYRLQLNHPLLRFILTIYYPDCVFEVGKLKSQSSNLSMLDLNKRQLDSVFQTLLDCESNIASISDAFLEIIDSADEFKEEIENKLFWILMGLNSSEISMEIVAEISHEGLEGD